jgi:hypothetical protein
MRIFAFGLTRKAALHGRTSWMGRFFDYLKTHGRVSDLAFVSFEHYPFDPCTITWKTLYSEPQRLKHILQVWRNDGVPKDLPLMVTEDHLANELTGPMTTIFAALWLSVLSLADSTAGHSE